VESITRFFGREAECSELVELVGWQRSLTLVGAPGCGKTRLAVEVCGRLADRYPAGLWFVELSSLTDPSLTSRAVADAVGARVPLLRSAEEALVDRLGSAECLLVLDNCEHVRDEVAVLVTRLLASCASVRVLATSRRALGLQDELVWWVPPLGRRPAVDMFRDRSRLATGRAQTEDGDTIDRICRRLDGLPLAIELIAAWTRVLTPSQILGRLDQALPLLSSRSRLAGSRHQAMEAAVDWSYELLEPAERLLFAELSVFSGGFDIEAVEAVAPDRDVSAGLARLVEHSLVVAEPTAGGGGVSRYRLLEPLRQSAERRLAASGEQARTRRRHLDHFLERALRADAELRSSDPSAALARLDAEAGNLRVALRSSRDQPDDVGLRLSTALAGAWALGGRVSEARAWIEEMLERGTSDRALLASALARAGRLAWRQLDYTAARKFVEQSLVVESELGDPLRIARRLRSLAMVALAQGQLDEAERLCERSIAAFRAHGDQHGLSLSLACLAIAAHFTGDHERGDRCAWEALALARATVNFAGIIYGLAGVAFGAVAKGDMTGLRALGSETASALRALGGILEDPGWMWTALAFASGEGRYRSALRLAGAIEDRARHDGVHFHEQFRRYMLPWLERARAHVGPAEAARLIEEGSHLDLEALIEEGLREPDGGDRSVPSAREREIAGLIAQGMSNVEIAERLVISKRTVESHVRSIKTKLGVARRAQVVSWALEAPEMREH
jgi:predicted ATPase/DNA-binding CsgD family transcriptional regulator